MPYSTVLNTSASSQEYLEYSHARVAAQLQRLAQQLHNEVRQLKAASWWSLQYDTVNGVPFPGQSSSREALIDQLFRGVPRSRIIVREMLRVGGSYPPVRERRFLLDFLDIARFWGLGATLTARVAYWTDRWRELQPLLDQAQLLERRTLDLVSDAAPSLELLQLSVVPFFALVHINQPDRCGLFDHPHLGLGVSDLLMLDAQNPRPRRSVVAQLQERAFRTFCYAAEYFSAATPGALCTQRATHGAPPLAITLTVPLRSCCELLPIFLSCLHEEEKLNLS